MGGKGSGKKQEIKLPKEEPKKKMVKKYRCMIGGQSKDFSSQKEAREMALDVLNTGRVFYLELSEVQVEDC